MSASYNTEKIRIVLVDDHVLFRQVLSRLLTEQPDFEVIAEMSDGWQVVEVLRRTEADLLLVDLELAEGEGFEVLRQVRSAGVPVRRIVLTGSEDRVALAVALDLGADGVVPKQAATQELLTAIRRVHQGRFWLDGRIHEEQSQGWESRDELTYRETEVARLVTEGLRYNEIARRLDMSPSTLNNHLRSIFEKLQGHGRAELAMHVSRPL